MAGRSGGGIALAVLVLLIAAGAGGGGTGGGDGAAGAQNGVGDAGARARDRNAAAVEQRLRADGLQVTRLEDDAEDDCAAHSYGGVHEFFQQHPCTASSRALYDVHDGQDAAVVAVAWVDMPDAAQAREFQRLVDVHGTGNLTELTRNGGPHASTEWTGLHYRSVRDDVTVVNAQAEPAASGANRLAERLPSTAVG